MSPNVFIVSEFVDNTQNSTGYYWSKIVDGLSEKFSKICVITSKSSHDKVVSPSALVTYILIKDIKYNKNLSSRLFGQVAQSLYFTKAIIQNVSRGDVIFSGTNPALLVLLISILKAIKGFKWIILVHDVFPENLVAAKIIHKKNIFYRLVKYFFDKAYSSADTLIAIGRDMLDLLAKKTKAQNKIEYVANWVDLKDVIPLAQDSSELICKPGVDDKVIFQFFGNLGRLQDIDNLLNAILLVNNKKASFVFIGSGSEESLILDFVKNNPTKNIAHIPGIPFCQNNIALSSCDISIVSVTKGMNGLGVPSKAYFSLAADKPLLVIADKDSELSRLISEEAYTGWLCEPGNPEKLASLIDYICNDITLTSLGRCRAIVTKSYEYQDAIKKYSKLISELLN
jgi:glycosyltransferase involved in cell wall biosynthesis